MKNILIFASLGGIAAAIAIYFTMERLKGGRVASYVTDADREAFDINENSGPAKTPRGHHALG